MPLIVSDEELREAGMTEQEARIELACRVFDAGRLDLWPAAKFAGLARGEFEEELITRGISVYRPTIDDVRSDLESLRRLGV